ncbi:hypothetical protein [Mycolicibacterium lutetiense]|uniref:Ribbon-helix-helix protein CopG domain-containing protein n=1 Tax=Mycolicibacterium lutetiense TaxID=1641992 RepID=A0ABS4ZZ84_9MYCO|nr:hypothetical protein [Mycolicibacterium lutetiense]MBP2454829.1 hypothetical protein [Mycolicibacterium lutetiense]
MSHKLSNEELRALMDEEARAAEAAAAEDIDDGAPLPAHVKASRPNRARSKVLQVRLNPDEMESLEMIAYVRHQPVSTVAREELLSLIERSRRPAPEGETVADLLDQMEARIVALRQVQFEGKRTLSSFARPDVPRRVD